MAKETPKKKPNLKPEAPTIRQKKVVRDLIENGGSMKAAMIKAGYSPEYAKNPKKFRETASFQELLEENLPDWLLTETHLELLEDKDRNIRLRAMQEGYKIKAKYEPEAIKVIQQYENMTYEELKKLYEQRTRNNDDD